jgi:hypothetical protein
LTLKLRIGSASVFFLEITFILSPSGWHFYDRLRADCQLEMACLAANLYSHIVKALWDLALITGSFDEGFGEVLNLKSSTSI